MKSLSYLIFFTLMNLLKNCSPECTHYYLMLEETSEDFGDVTVILPLPMSEIINDPILNTTEEFVTMQNNTECVLDVKCDSLCQARVQTSCPWKQKRATPSGIDEYVTETTPSTTANYKTPTKSSLTTVTTTIETTTVDKDADETTTDFAANRTSSLYTAHKEDKKETGKIVAIALAGATGGGVLTYLIAKKIQHILQYGAYHLPA